MHTFDNELVKKTLYTGVICDVMDQMGYRNQAIDKKLIPLFDHTVIFGPAFTSIATEVYSMPADPLMAQCRVVDQLKEGEVYVLVTRGNYTCAVFGELFATAVWQRKGVGVLLDGYVRDQKALKEMDFPVFYAGCDPRTSKGRAEINECQIPVQMGSVTINPGDYIFGDVDGVAVIPEKIVDEVIKRSFDTVLCENKVRDGLLRGESLEKVYGDHGAI